MKLHPLTLTGALMASWATAFFVYLGVRELFGSTASIPFLFLALLLGMVLISLFTWFKPEPMPIWLAFIGIMLLTYNGAKARVDEFLPALLTGLPFILAAILVQIGEKQRACQTLKPTEESVKQDGSAA